jgi:16S rRNA (guanine1207-N2)-methyltransferase
MHNISQIIERNLHRQSSAGKGLWINPEKDPAWRNAARSCSSLELLCQDYGAFLFHQQAGGEVQFAAFPVESKSAYSWIILNLPRQKALLRMLLDYAASLLADGGVLWLAGENKAGIKSAEKILKTCFTRVSKLDNARHCTLYEATLPLSNHIFDAGNYQEKWMLGCGGNDIKVASYPGVFAHGRLDGGTALLLGQLTELGCSGEILDFGCGAGVIGACIATQKEDVNVTFLDTSALALKSCEDTLAANQLNGCLLASDGLSEVKQTYDMIISNPPIHAGVKTNNRMSVRLLESVHKHLRPGGRLILVANRHLPYERGLSDGFHQVSELVKNKHFKVIVAENPL